MQLSTNLDNLLVVTLSRRNLEGLLEQLDTKATNEAAQIMRRTESGVQLIVVAEEDAVHYHADGRDGVAGRSGPSQSWAEEIAA